MNWLFCFRWFVILILFFIFLINSLIKERLSFDLVLCGVLLVCWNCLKIKFSFLGGMLMFWLMILIVGFLVFLWRIILIGVFFGEYLLVFLIRFNNICWNFVGLVCVVKYLFFGSMRWKLWGIVFWVRVEICISFLLREIGLLDIESMFELFWDSFKRLLRSFFIWIVLLWVICKFLVLFLLRFLFFLIVCFDSFE